MKPIQTPQGFWVLDEDTHISKWAAETGRLDHDRWLLDQIEKFIPAGGIVVDVGAYIGDHTLAYSRYVGEDGIVLAFEPNPIAHECLCKNLELMPSRVNALPYGLSNCWEGLELYSSSNVGATHAKSKGGKEDRLAQARMFDELWHEFEDEAPQTFTRLDFFKVDAEGFEMKILTGAWKTLKKFRPVILVEINTQRLLENGSNVFDIMAWASRTFGAFEHQILPSECNYTADQYDLLILPVNKL